MKQFALLMKTKGVDTDAVIGALHKMKVDDPLADAPTTAGAGATPFEPNTPERPIRNPSAAPDISAAPPSAIPSMTPFMQPLDANQVCIQIQPATTTSYWRQ